MDQNAKQQIIDRLKDANNILVTVSANPSVDQLASCIGITIFLNKLGKHATAVFSGKVPSTIEFLKPSDTIETDTNSLRDFIIALDKSKADKLRYKVEDKVVKIFITPYRTSLTDKDLEFSQGDFNVDAVVGIGVKEREDMDQAIMAHGRILHDATVISVNNRDQGNLGTINWVDLNASSLSEMLVELCAALGKDKLDGQMATAFLTGIVAETNRFSNDKTSAQTMTIASELMAAGANQQLIASQLEAAATKPVAKTTEGAKPEIGDNDDITATEDGSLQISHEEAAVEDKPKEKLAEEPLKKPTTTNLRENPEPDDYSHSVGGVKHTLEPLDLPKPVDNPLPSIVPTALGSTPSSPAADLALPPTPSNFPALGKAEDRRPTQNEDSTRLADISVTQASQAGKLSANTEPEHLQEDPSTDPLSMPMPSTQPPIFNKSTIPTLETMQKADSSPKAKPEPAPAASGPIENAREAVDAALRSSTAPPRLEPLQALGSQSVDLTPANDFSMPQPSAAPAVDPSSGLPASLVPPISPTETTAANASPSSPPPVPPPLMPPGM